MSILPCLRIDVTGRGVQQRGAGYDVRWFAWRDVRAALLFGRGGGIALHRFRHDLRRFGLGPNEAACHMLSADRAALITLGAEFGLRAAWLEPPRPRRPDIWHFDIFGTVLQDLEAAYPPPVADPTGEVGRRGSSGEVSTLGGVPRSE